MEILEIGSEKNPLKAVADWSSDGVNDANTDNQSPGHGLDAVQAGTTYDL